MPVQLVNAYCTEAQIRAEMQDEAAVVSSDLICKAINAASRHIDDYCSGNVPKSRRFWQDAAVKTRVYQCESPTFAYVDDISDTTGLVVKTDNDDDGVYETTWTIGTDFALWPLNADVDGTDAPMAFWKIVAIGNTDIGKRFPLYDRRAGLQVQAKFGWPAIPKEVEEACILRAIAIILRKDSPLGTRAQSEFGILPIPDSDPDVIQLLEPYVKARPWSVQYISEQGRNSLFHRRYYY